MPIFAFKYTLSIQPAGDSIAEVTWIPENT